MGDLKKRLLEKYIKNNIPYYALFEVTKRCIARCVHCYIDEYRSNDLSIDEIDDLFRQLKETGVVELALSGGEPFIRPDFTDILRVSRKYKFFLSILTTGILIDEENAAILKECDVKSVEMSILGSNEKTHDSLMRYHGAFAGLMRAVKILTGKSIDVTLKTTVLKGNYTELPAIKSLAHGLGVRFNPGVTIVQKINHDPAPLEHSLSADEFAEIDLLSVNNGLLPGEDHSAGAVLSCNAGCTSISIGPEGDVYPCVLLREPLGNIRKRSLRDIVFDNPAPVLKRMRELKDADVKECFGCAIRKYCRRCPGTAYQQTGEIDGISKIDCALAEKMHQATLRKKETM